MPRPLAMNGLRSHPGLRARPTNGRTETSILSFASCLHFLGPCRTANVLVSPLIVSSYGPGNAA